MVVPLVSVVPPNRTAVLGAAVAGGLGPLAPDRPVVPADAREHGMVGRQRDGFLLAAGRALSSNIPRWKTLTRILGRYMIDSEKRCLLYGKVKTDKSEYRSGSFGGH